VIDRDDVVDFIESHRVVMTAGAAALLLLCVIFLIVMRVNSSKREKVLSAATANAIPVTELFLPAEPLQVPGVLLFRGRKPAWNVDEAKRWYTEPDEASLERLRAIGQASVDAMLESVP